MSGCNGVPASTAASLHKSRGGHKQNEPEFDADHGDVVSFHEQLKAHCQENDKDSWFVMEKMPFDVVNTSNHELCRSTVVKCMKRPVGFVDWWGDRHLASNIVLSQTKQSLSD
jgi:hypothetical protein